MEFQLSREALLRVLNHVSSIVDSRSTISILSNLYIKCENNQIEIRSTDLDISIKEYVSADSTKDGEATVNARIFTDIIRKTKKNTIIKVKNEGNRLTINSENSVFELNSLSADEFPKFVPLDKENSFELKDAKNLEMITRIFFSQRRKMLKKPFNQIFNNAKEVASKFNIDLNLRPQNLEPEIYFKLTKEYEDLKR